MIWLAAVLLAQVSATTGETLETFAPYTGARLAVLPQSGADDVRGAFARARTAQQLWAARPVRERARIVLRFHDLVVERQDEAYLIAYHLKDLRLGYLVARVVEGRVVITTFLFLTMEGTPEYRLLHEQLRLCRRDIEHLNRCAFKPPL